MSRAMRVSLIACALCGWVLTAFVWFQHRFERWPVVKKQQVKDIVRQNPFLAAERLLERMGAEVRGYDGTSRLQLPPVPATLVIPVSREIIGAKQSQAMIEWIRRGGHLVVALPERAHQQGAEAVNPSWSPQEDDDDSCDDGAVGEESGDADAAAPPHEPLAENENEETTPEPEPEPEDSVIEPSSDEAWDDVPPPNEAADVEPPSDHLLDALGIGWYSDPSPPSQAAPESDTYELLPTPAKVLTFDGRYDAVWHKPLVADGDGYRGIRLGLGEGTLTIWPHGRFIENDYLLRADNAALLWETVSWGDLDGPVELIRRLRPPKLLEQLAEHAWRPLLAILLLVVLGLWAAMPRFGPIIDTQESVRRSLLEHLTATGRLLWRYRATDALLETGQTSIDVAARKLHPAWQSLQVDAKSAWLAQKTGLPKERIAYVLSRHTPTRGRDILASIALLEQIRRSL